MPIKYLPSVDGRIRALQEQLAEVGRIRCGKHNGKYPEKLDKFRFTSPDRDLIAKVGQAYGGEPQAWTPQGGTGQQWEVFSDADRIAVYVPQQHIDPNNEAWAAGRTCVRRCNGVFERIKQVPCVCASGAIKDPRELCKPTVRVQLMLRDVPGIGVWRLESHGEYACGRLAMLAPFIAQVPMPVPAFLFLKPEKRRLWNADKNKFDTREFYVPEIHISAVSMEQIAVGGDALTQALTAAGAPAAIGSGGPAAIAAAPQAMADDEVGRILAAIEKANTPEALRIIQAALMDRGIDDPTIVASWQSKAVAVSTAAEVGGSAPGQYAVGDEVTVAGTTFTKVSDKPFGDQGAHHASLREVVDKVADAKNAAPVKAGEPCKDPFCGGACGYTPNEHLEAHGAATLIRDMPVGLPVVMPTRTAREAAEPAVEDVVIPEVVEPAGEPDGPGKPDEAPVKYNRASERVSLMAEAAGLGWDTPTVLRRIEEYCGIERATKATGEQLHAVREAIRKGELT